MGPDLARDISRMQKVLIVAPAGCGKTRLIADATRYSTGKNLVLTHTHAGVRALRRLVRQHGVINNANITTIDGWALRYATWFRSLSGWTKADPTEGWDEVHESAVRALSNRAVVDLVRRSYSGIYVDEYQDCTRSQHALVRRLAEILPCRVLGDPLQAVLWTVRPEACSPWSDVVATFGEPLTLAEPWRWRDRNPELGVWLKQVRASLVEGRPISLRHTPVEVEDTPGHLTQVAMCRLLAGRDGSIIALRRWPQMCQGLAKDLRNLYVVMESVECGDLAKWCDRLERARGTDRTVVALDFVISITARLPGGVKELRDSVGGAKKRTFRRPDLARLADAATRVGEAQDVRVMGSLLATCAQLEDKITYKRRELWDAMREALRCYDPVVHGTLAQAAWSSRDRLRRMGWRTPRRCLSTPLRVKGLEFHHGLVLNLGELVDPEETYVAMTRASDSLTVVTDAPALQRPKPRYLAT